MKNVLLLPTTCLFHQTELGFQIEFKSLKILARDPQTKPIGSEPAILRNTGPTRTRKFWGVQLDFWKPFLDIVEQLNIKEFPSLMLKKPASQIVTFEEKEEQWEQVVKPVEKWGKIVNKWDIEVRPAEYPCHWRSGLPWSTDLDFV